MTQTENKQEIIFEEKQNFNNWVAWTVIIFTFSITAVTLIYQLITGKEVGNHPASNALLIGVLVFHGVGIYLMYYAKITVRIEKEAIYYGFNLPTNDLNKIMMSQIKSLEVISHSFVGYGYRLSLKYGTVYNTMGKIGLQIITKHGEKILLGTRKPEELKAAIKKLNLLPNQE